MTVARVVGISAVSKVSPAAGRSVPSTFMNVVERRIREVLSRGTIVSVIRETSVWETVSVPVMIWVGFSSVMA